MLLNAKPNYHTGNSDHQYASQFGWSVDVQLLAEEYNEACECFKEFREIENLAYESIKRSIRFRKSVLGRLLLFLMRLLKGENHA